MVFGRGGGDSSSSSKDADASKPPSNGESKWKVWGRTAFDKSIVISDWAAGYANAGSAKLGGERFFPKSNDFPEEVAKCERILRAFTVEGVAADVKEVDVADGKGSFMKKKRKVLRKIPPKLIKQAKGIVIYTSMRSGIAPLGGSGGVGLMLARLPDNSWSAPSSIAPQNFAVGLLLGFDIFDAILLINTEAAMEKFKGHKVTLGAETAVAAGPFGAGISGEMGLDKTPVYSYVRSRGLYGGAEAIAQAFLHRFDENERVYYWPGISAADIFEGKVRMPPQVEPLHRALRDAEAGIAQGDSLERTVYENVIAPPNRAVKVLQEDEASDLLQDGEKLKLPPTPKELDAMEEAGIPDEHDLELERQALQERLEFEKREREEIRNLPPPPKHPQVVKYWSNRALPGTRRRVAPAHESDGSSLTHSPLAREVIPAAGTGDEQATDDAPAAASEPVSETADRMAEVRLDDEKDAAQSTYVADETDVASLVQDQSSTEKVDVDRKRAFLFAADESHDSLLTAKADDSVATESTLGSTYDTEPEVHDFAQDAADSRAAAKDSDATDSTGLPESAPSPTATTSKEEADTPVDAVVTASAAGTAAAAATTAAVIAVTHEAGAESEAETDDFEDALTASESAPVLPTEPEDEAKLEAELSAKDALEGPPTPRIAEPESPASPPRPLSPRPESARSIEAASLTGSHGAAPEDASADGVQKPVRPSRPPRARARPVSTLVTDAPDRSPSSSPRLLSPNEATAAETSVSAIPAVTASAESKSLPQMLLFVDWDETITAQDTLSLIAPPPGKQTQGPDFAHYTEAYMSDLASHEEAFGPRDTLERQMTFLESIDEVERKSVARVQDGGLFVDAELSEIKSRAETVSFRDGWDDAEAWLLPLAEQGKVEMDIISVGWSAEFIRHAILQRRSPGSIALGGKVPSIVCANEVEMRTNDDGEKVGTGKLTKSNDAISSEAEEEGEGRRSGIRTGLHKLAELKRLFSRFVATTDAARAPTTVYIGDSNTDLPCLLEARYGLLMGDAGSLKSTVDRIGLSERLADADDWIDEGAKDGKEGENILIAVKDWNEAKRVLETILERLSSQGSVAE